MYKNFFAERLSQLRAYKGISARELSLSLGQSESYINKLENQSSYPSMEMFFYICEYFKITPKEFFDDKIEYPILIKSVVDDLNTLSEAKINNIYQIIKDLKPETSSKRKKK